MDTLKKTLSLVSGEAAGVAEKADSSALVRSKILSLWNNVKYGKTAWALDAGAASGVSAGSPAWLLGQCYHRNPQGSPLPTQGSVSPARDCDSRQMESFNADFHSRLWFTYRKDFRVLPGSSFRSDCGWGCMIRCGQMMLGNALLLHLLGRHWRWRDGATPDHSDRLHRAIVGLFADSPHSPFSIHSLMAIAQTLLHQRAGDWFGPAATAHLLKSALERASPANSPHSLLKSFRIYVAQDGTVYQQDVLDLCLMPFTETKWAAEQTGGEDITKDFSIVEDDVLISDSVCYVTGVPYFLDSRDRIEQAKPALDECLRSQLYPDVQLAAADAEWSPVLIMVPVRLGSGDKVNPIYVPCLQALLATDTCVGIVGGRPRHALYFVGFQENNLIHLDPHLVQSSVDLLAEQGHCSLSSFHCSSPKKMSVTKMDPSCCLGFVISGKSQFEAWCDITRHLVVPPAAGANGQLSSTCYPIFSIESGRARDVQLSRPHLMDSIRHVDPVIAEGELSETPDDAAFASEDFIFL